MKLIVRWKTRHWKPGDSITVVSQPTTKDSPYCGARVKDQDGVIIMMWLHEMSRFVIEEEWLMLLLEGKELQYK